MTSTRPRMNIIFSTETSSLAQTKFSVSEEERKSIEELKLAPHQIKIYGKILNTPRKIGFYSENPELISGYKFSGTEIKAQKMPKSLLEILERVNIMTHSNFNAILANRYENNNDYISAHSDDEKFLGKEGVVTISLGAERKLRIRDKKTKAVVKDVKIRDEDFYWMRGNFQKEFTHEIPKENSQGKNVRISLTFRRHES